MLTMVAVIIVLTLPCVLLIKPPSDIYDHGRLSVVFDVRASPPTPTKLEMEIPHPVNHHSRSLEVDVTRTLNQTDNSPNHSQIYKHGHSSTNTDSLDSKFNFSVNLKNSIHNESDKDIEEIEDQNGGNGWTTLLKPEQTFNSNLTSTENIKSVGGLSRPSFEIEVLNPPSKYDGDELGPLTKQGSNKLNTYYAPSIGIYSGTHPLILPNGEMSVLVTNADTNSLVPNVDPEEIILPESPTNIQAPIIIPDLSNIMNIHIPTPSSQQYTMELKNLNWQRFGLLVTFIKLGLVKLKAVGFIKILFFFLFKLKLLMILVFFKIISMFNMLLLFKFVVLPLFILPLFPIILSIISPTFMVGLLSIPGNIIKYMIMGPAYFGKITPSSTSETKTNSSVGAVSSSLNFSETSTIPHTAIKKNPYFKYY